MLQRIFVASPELGSGSGGVPPGWAYAVHCSLGTTEAFPPRNVCHRKLPILSQRSPPTSIANALHSPVHAPAACSTHSAMDVQWVPVLSSPLHELPGPPTQWFG